MKYECEVNRIGKQKDDFEELNDLYKSFFSESPWEDFQEHIKPDIKYWKKKQYWTTYETACLAFNVAPLFFKSSRFGKMFNLSYDESEKTSRFFVSPRIESIFHFLQELSQDHGLRVAYLKDPILSEGLVISKIIFETALAESKVLEKKWLLNPHKMSLAD